MAVPLLRTCGLPHMPVGAALITPRTKPTTSPPASRARRLARNQAHRRRGRRAHLCARGRGHAVHRTEAHRAARAELTGPCRKEPNVLEEHGRRCDSCGPPPDNMHQECQEVCKYHWSWILDSPSPPVRARTIQAGRHRRASADRPFQARSRVVGSNTRTRFAKVGRGTPGQI
jgi:hypothetical protein